MKPPVFLLNIVLCNTCNLLGDVLMTYTPKSWAVGDTTCNGWVTSVTQYDGDGRSTATYQATYLDSGDDTLHYSITDGVVTISNDVYNDATQSNDGTALQNGTTTYTGDGQTATTTDQYGGVTTNTYDASGQLVATLYPDGTQTRSIYDALGRVIWQSDRNTVAALDSGVNATETVYNSLGEVTATYQFSGVIISLSADPNAPSDSGLEISTLTNGGMQFSSAFTYYNAQGQTIETIAP